MKRILGVIVAGLVALATVGTAHAFEVIQPNSAGNARVESGTEVDDSVFIAGQSVDIRGSIMKDLFAAGNSLTVDGTVDGNVIGAGGTVKVTGPVAGDIIVAGGTVTIEPTSTVAGDVLVFGGTTEILGTVNGKISAYTGTLTIDGTVKGDVVAQTDQLLLGDSGSIGGSLSGTVGQALEDTVSTKVGGTVDVTLNRSTKPNLNTIGLANGFSAISTLSVVYSLLTAIVTGLVLVFLFPTFMSSVRDRTYKEPVPTATNGLLVTIVGPVLFVLLMVFFITIPLGLLELTVFALLAMVGGVFANLWVGDLVGKKQWSPFTSLAIGTVILTLIGIIPIIGPLLAFLAWLVGMGGVSQSLWSMMRKAGK